MFQLLTKGLSRDLFRVSDPTMRRNIVEVAWVDLDLICEISNSDFDCISEKKVCLWGSEKRWFCEYCSCSVSPQQKWVALPQLVHERSGGKQQQENRTNREKHEKAGRPHRRRNSTQKGVLLKSLRIKHRTSADCGSCPLNPQTRKWFINESFFTKAHKENFFPFFTH